MLTIDSKYRYNGVVTVNAVMERRNSFIQGGQSPIVNYMANFLCPEELSYVQAKAKGYVARFLEYGFSNFGTPFLEKCRFGLLLIIQGVYKMTNSLTIFNFKNNQVRAELVNNEPYFCGVDVCEALSIKNNRNVIARLKDGVRTVDTIDNLGRTQSVSFINEKNVYKVAFQSRKPEAEAFTDWVCEEVLPSIRKTGSYSTSNDLVKVSTHLRKKPSSKREIVLSSKARQEIGGIIKSVVNHALDEKLPTIAKNTSVDRFEFLNDMEFLLTRTMLKPYEVVDCLNYFIKSFDKIERTKSVEIFCRILKGVSNQIVSYETILSEVRANARAGHIGNILLFAENQNRGVRITEV
ncbi:MAG: Bro-N domain-containing protein [Alphaproteobacteria bacterium]